MSACLEFWFLDVHLRRAAGSAMTSWQPHGPGLIAFPDEAVTALDRILEPYGSNERAFAIGYAEAAHHMGRRAWAFIALDKEYRLAGHLVSIRPSPSAMPFAPYRDIAGSLPEDHVPSLGCIVVMEKEALAQAASHDSPLLREAWGMLQDRPTGHHWLCLPDPLPTQWVKQSSRDDDERFLAHVRR